MNTTFNMNLTDWFGSGQRPTIVGEYNASVNKVVWMRRWWNGSAWSDFYSEGQPVPRTIAIQADQDRMYWRGLISPHEA